MDQESSSLRSQRIAEAIAAYEREGPGALERWYVEHPELAAEIRDAAATLDLLQQAGSPGPVASLGAIEPGTILSHYRVVSLLGQGGMGRVFRARDLLLPRDVAIKVFAVPFSSPEVAVARIKHEAELLAQVEHQYIVRVLETGITEEGLPFLVMEHVDGTPLSAILARLLQKCSGDPARLKGAELLAEAATGDPGDRASSYADAVVRLLLPIIDAIENAHRVGVIHRDIKPSNILVDRTGRPRLLDFGIAREIDSSTRTASGMASGTPPYMSPEQVSGSSSSRVTASTDVYSLGMTLYQALTLHIPFDAETAAKIYWRILNVEPARPRSFNAALSVDLETICLAAIEKETKDRFASAAELARNLRCYLDRRPIPRRPLGRVAHALRLARRRPWQTTAAAALLLASSVVAFTTITTRREAQRADRFRQLTTEGYAALGHRLSPDLAVLRAIVKEMNQIAPDDVETRVFNGELDRREGIESAGAADDRGRDAIAAARAALAARGAAAAEEVDSLLDDALVAIQESVACQPEGGAGSLLAEVGAIRGESIAARAVRAGASPPLPGSAGLAIDGDARDADVHLFRYELQAEPRAAGDSRLVPVPVALRRAATADAERAGDSLERVDVSPPPGSWVLRVDAVADGSPAARAGIRRGDFVVSIGEVPVANATIVLPSPAARTAADPVPCFRRVARLDGRELGEPFDLDVVRLRVPADSEVDAELAATASMAAQRLRVRRTQRGFEPELGSALAALRCSLPPEGVELDLSSGGLLRRVRLEGGAPSGLELVPTTNPLVAVPQDRLGGVPLRERALPPGSYLLLVKAPGCEELRIPIQLVAGRETLVRAELLPEAISPPNFVRVACGAFVAGAEAAKDALPVLRPGELWLDDFWISRTEITVADYLEFLNDRTTLREIAEGERTHTFTRVPRGTLIDRAEDSICKPLWKKQSDGRYATDWDPLKPISCITCNDADAWCRWRSDRADARRDGWSYRLPTESEWEKAARGVDGRVYPWGDAANLRFSKSDSAHDLKGIDPRRFDDIVFEPVDRFTCDESPFDVRDTASGVLEWCLGVPFDSIPFRRPWRGGVSKDAAIVGQQSTVRRSGNPDRPSPNDGIRVVAWRRVLHPTTASSTTEPPAPTPPR